MVGMHTEINNIYNFIALNSEEYLLTHAVFRIASNSMTWLAGGVNERM
jgi:hypothetical protein